MKQQPTPEQKARAEERRERLRQLWEKIAAMSDEQRAEFAAKMPVIVTCEGHALSPNNTLLLCYQSESVTIVGGFQQWRKAGRTVRKGERALGIWIPKTSEKKDQPANQPEKPAYFVFGSVFDVSQTEEAQS